jgi:hypothetical protein
MVRENERERMRESAHAKYVWERMTRYQRKGARARVWHILSNHLMCERSRARKAFGGLSLHRAKARKLEVAWARATMHSLFRARPLALFHVSIPLLLTSRLCLSLFCISSRRFVSPLHFSFISHLYFSFALISLSLSLSLSPSPSPSHSLALALALSLSRSRSRSLALSLSHSLALSLSRSLALSLSRTLARALALSLSRALALSLSRALALSLSLTFLLSRSRVRACTTRAAAAATAAAVAAAAVAQAQAQVEGGVGQKQTSKVQTRTKRGAHNTVTPAHAERTAPFGRPTASRVPPRAPRGRLAPHSARSAAAAAWRSVRQRQSARGRERLGSGARRRGAQERRGGGAERGARS